MLTTSTRRLAAAVGAVWLASAGAALAQTQSDPIDVTGRTPEQAQHFVEQLAVAPGSGDQLARWDRTICTSVAGLPARQGQFIADRIAQRAHAVGLQPGAPGCTANIAVIATADSDTAARRMYESDAGLFALRQTNTATLGQSALDDFLNTPRAVRWWHVAETMTADGFSLMGDASSGGMENAPVARSSGSRLREDTRQDLNRAVIIIDSRRVQGVQLHALADYIAMVALAQIDAGADTSGYPTVMNLFADGQARTQAANGMTDWDTAYLDGLYSSTRTAATPGQQEREITRRMLASAGGGGAP
ncbi:MAG: hypothetical protein AB7O98_05160 [Hyphomonadaceae bacterium]